MRSVSGARAAFAALAVLALSADASADPCADGVHSYGVGQDGGFNADLLPQIVLGVPWGEGELAGSLDVVTLGHGGSITLSFDDNEIVDGPGVDFRVFENAFRPNGASVFVEAATVWASRDGVDFVPFQYAALGFAGLAGVTPVYAHPSNGIDPRSAEAGGDGFDLADVGLSSARFIRIEDGGDMIPDPGNRFPIKGFGQSGFDLDAIVASNSRELCSSCCDVTADGAVTIEDVLVLSRIAASDPPPQACGGGTCRPSDCSDTDGNGNIELLDIQRCLDKVVALRVQCAAGPCDLS